MRQALGTARLPQRYLPPLLLGPGPSYPDHHVVLVSVRILPCTQAPELGADTSPLTHSAEERKSTASLS
ncbi:hypothetical protein NDU88_000330 [Pleurodeles waltl]|uniref:Uncharacterized protein n=1 Tax=Pleurodeles waltl TaxID=8319 RepID=A0AAV7U771_PLEWA|nr:hypothetical protein NDU88_000330 [Pleurodeles waltl]